MKNKIRTIFVLHEYGSPAHYNGLSALCKANNIDLCFREFRFLHLIGSGILHKRIHIILKQPLNVLFLLNLLITKNRIIVLGMHPYDKRLPILRFILKKHRLYYHTSFTAWEPSEMKKYASTSIRKIERIKSFIKKDVIHSFAVTQKAKDSMCTFTTVNSDKVSVVYHSYNFNLQIGELPPKNTFIYVGRMDKQKGVIEICDFFKKNPNLQLTLIGTGDCDNYIKDVAKMHNNIIFLGYVTGLKRISTYYQQNAFFLLNSKKTSEWEELFGQVIVESMSCGCIPICVNHSGPKEIINSGLNGFLFEEGKMPSCINNDVLNLSENNYFKLRMEAYKRGHEFESAKIAYRWEAILA